MNKYKLLNDIEYLLRALSFDRFTVYNWGMIVNL